MKDTKSDAPTYKCCVCGKKFVGYGNSALPVRKGVCCDSCNAEVVLPVRFMAITQGVDPRRA